MSEFDFDELDKAVNSLMGKVGDDMVDDNQKTKTLDINTTLGADDKPKYAALGKAAESIGSETLTMAGEHTIVEKLGSSLPVSELPTAEMNAMKQLTPQLATPPTPPQPDEKPKSPAVKRPNNGRFMDMVHPSADMKQTTPAPNLIVPTRAAAQEKPAPVVEPTSVAVTDMDSLPVTDAPLVTPFLPDAKVEKRPLGSAITISDATANVQPVANALPEPITDTEPIEIIDTEDEVREVEPGPINSDEKPHDDGSSDEQRPLNATEFDKNETSEEQKLQAIESIEASETDGTVLAVESGDTEKIKQGPLPAPVKNDGQGDIEANGAIYDVKDYHPPAVQGKKQKSGWGIVVIIIVIIVLAIGIVGGAYLLLGLNK